MLNVSFENRQLQAKETYKVSTRIVRLLLTSSNSVLFSLLNIPESNWLGTSFHDQNPRQYCCIPSMWVDTTFGKVSWKYVVIYDTYVNHPKHKAEPGSLTTEVRCVHRPELNRNVQTFPIKIVIVRDFWYRYLFVWPFPNTTRNLCPFVEERRGSFYICNLVSSPPSLWTDVNIWTGAFYIQSSANTILSAQTAPPSWLQSSNAELFFPMARLLGKPSELARTVRTAPISRSQSSLKREVVENRLSM